MVNIAQRCFANSLCLPNFIEVIQMHGSSAREAVNFSWRAVLMPVTNLKHHLAEVISHRGVFREAEPMHAP